MPVYFQGVPGRTAVLQDPAVQGSVSLAAVSPYLGWTTHRSIFTRATHSHAGNFSFLHTVGNQLFIYAFGDRVGRLSLSGLSMPADCAGGVADHGAERVFDWYRDNRVAGRQAPVRVVLGTRTAFDAFVSRLTQDVVDPSLRLMSFNLELEVPEEG